MEQIQQILVGNQGNRLTAELINGMYHGIDQAVRAMIEQAKAELAAANDGKEESA